MQGQPVLMLHYLECGEIGGHMNFGKAIWAAISLVALVAAFAMGTIYQSKFSSHSEETIFIEGDTTDPHAGHGRADSEHPGEDDTQSSKNEIDWCFEHRVPESECTQCNAALIGAFKARNDWCAGHNLPESHCRLCNSEIVFPQEMDLKREARPLESISIYFPENKVNCSTSESVIRFASAETADRAGLSFVPTMEFSLPATIDAPAEVKLNATQTVTVASTVPVSIVRWMAEPGEKISEGQPIAQISSPEIADLRARLIEYAADLAANQKDHSRKEALHQRRLISEAEWIDAGAALSTATAKFESTRGLLISAGLSEVDLDIILRDRSVSPVTMLRASSGGVLIEREAPLGELIEPGNTLAIISDPNSLWIEAKVGERDIWRVKTGQAIEFSSDGSSLNKTSGKIIWAAQYLDEITRIGVVRASVNPGDAHIYAGEYGRLTISIDDGSKAVLVPKDAVQWEGCCNVVFVKEAADVIRPKKVRLARGDESHYRVVDGLVGGEWIVVSGSYLLKTELRKSSIGAGCCGLDAEA
jgi:cobalt-zinc-cadmium efflux system membrane fusion protein